MIDDIGDCIQPFLNGKVNLMVNSADAQLPSLMQLSENLQANCSCAIAATMRPSDFRLCPSCSVLLAMALIILSLTHLKGVHRRHIGH